MARSKQLLKEALRIPVEIALRAYLAILPKKRFDPAKVERILIFAYHGLGNFIMYTPALRLLRERYPKARIDLQVGNNTGCEEVLAESGLFDHTYNVPYNAGPWAWLARAGEIRRTRYDITINEFHSHSWPLALTIVASRAPFRVGHVTSPGWSRSFSRYSFVFNAKVGMREDEHEVERYLDVVAAAGVPRISPSEARCFIHLTGADREFARAFLEKSARRADEKIIGIQPGTSASMRWKQWPLDRYRQLIERLTVEQPDSRVLLFGSPGEVEMINGLARDFGPNVTVAAGKTTVKQAAALIEQCEVLICNDSGLMHMAVAVGTPVVAIYGPTDLRRTAPLGDGHTVIRHELPCSPCFKLEGDEQVHLCSHHDCLMTITPEEVFHMLPRTANRVVGEALAQPK